MTEYKACRSKSVLCLTACLLLAFVAGMQVWMGADGDKAWLLLCADKLFDGRRPYVDSMEINPPLVLWLYQIPVFVSRILQLYSGWVLGALTLGLCAFSIFLSAKLLRHHAGLATNTNAYRFILWLLAFILVFWPNTIYFADREHLFITLTLPYFLRFLPGLNGYLPPKSTRWIIALMAALGFCIKPHFMVFFITVQLLNLAFTRKLSSVFCLENWVIGISALLYLFAAYRLTPEYFFIIIPIAAATYGGYNNGIGTTIFLYFPAAFSFLFAFAGLQWKSTTAFRRDCWYIITLMIASVLYININNGWLYTFFPLNSFVMLAVGWIMLDCVWLLAAASDPKTRYNLKVSRFFCVVVLFFNIVGTLLPFWLMLSSTYPTTHRDRLVPAFIETIQDEKAPSFGAFSIATNFWPRLVTATGAKMETRFQNLWPLPKFIISDENFTRQYQWVIDYTAEGLADDLNNNKAAIVFVDSSPFFGKTGKHLDIIAYLSRNPKFAAAWKPYSLLKTVGLCEDIDPANKQKIEAGCRYDVFKRAAE